MTARELEGSIMRTGQERALRKLCIAAGLANAEKVATMATIDVCEKIAESYDMVATCDEGDRILLVAKSNYDALWKLLVPIDR